MGAVKSKVAKKLHCAIRTNSYDRAKEIISKCPDVVNYPIHSGKTTPMCRVAYLCRLEMANLFLDCGADIDLPCKKNGNTPLMWAAWRNNVDMLNFLLEKGANVHILNHEGENVIDIWYDAYIIFKSNKLLLIVLTTKYRIRRVSYECALIIKNKGLELKSLEYYTEKCDIPFDISLFLEYLSQEKQIESHKIFFEKLLKEQAELRNRDLVIDPRETWKQWLKRTANFDEPPMIDRYELPDELQPHRALFSRVENYLNGINPYPPGHRWNKKKNKVASTKDENKDSSCLNLVGDAQNNSGILKHKIDNNNEEKENIQQYEIKKSSLQPENQEEFSEHFYIESDSEDCSDSDCKECDEEHFEKFNKGIVEKENKEAHVLEQIN